jgi:16S rRNA (adenine1518-N6/adenine1519-N6)-dimethyltransferase
MEDKYGKYRAKKRYGQNFLQDQAILQKIIDSNQLTPEDTVLEIGMGTGVLTAALAATGCQVIGVEIDLDLVPVLQEKFSANENVTILIGDFLKIAEGLFADIDKPIKVIANIPYYITTPILEELLEYKNKITTITLMMQREVADRLIAAPSTKDYGSLTIFIQYFTDVSQVCAVPRTAFHPVPKVDSSVVQLVVRQTPLYPVVSERRFFKITRGAFWGRRKTLRNTLKQSPYTHYSQEMLDKIEADTGIDLNRRGETLSIEEFAKLANVDLSQNH